MQLFLISLAVSAVGALASLVLGKSEMLAKTVGCVAGAAASCLAIAAGIGAVVGPVQTFSALTSFFTFSLRLDPLTGILLAVIGVLSLAAWIYGLAYFDEYKGKGIGLVCLFMNAFIASMNMVVAADNVFWFLVFFELMSLTSYFLVILEQTEASIKGGFMYLVMAHAGFFMIMMSYLVMTSTTGSFEFESFRTTAFSPVTASLCFMLAFFGFGFKAGIIPFHSWLPMAHPAAPSNVSAVMSGGMIKIGIFGMVKVGFDLLGSSDVQLWWGIVVVLFGAISSVLGVAYALAEHDIKRLLAYHSVENIGIILLGVGTALIGAAIDNGVLCVLGMLAGLFHLINHAMFKGLLFLGAGSVLYACETRDMESLGGLRRSMPTTAICFLIGSLAISAIPPLNGFVSEWFTYQGLITAAMGGSGLLKLVCAFGVVMLAITGALAVTCFVKAYGVTFLGNPRSAHAANAKEVPAVMRVSMVVLSAICIVLGIGAPWVVPALANAAAVTVGDAAIEAATGIVLVNPVIDMAISTPLVAVLLAAAVLVPWLIIRAKSTGGVKNVVDPWACGYNPTPDMPLVAGSVGAQVKMFWQPLFAIRDALTGVRSLAASSKAQPADAAAQHAGATGSEKPQGVVASWSKALSGRIEGGDFRVYITYIVVTLVVFLVLAVAVL